VTLSPTNPEYRAIVLTGEDAASVSVIAELVTVLRG
jgi:SOS-response transcriptional repressor LexA